MSEDNIATPTPNPEVEYVNNVLTLTRDQLSRAMSACAELEALVTFERKRNAELEAKIAELQASKAKPATDK